MLLRRVPAYRRLSQPWKDFIVASFLGLDVAVGVMLFVDHALAVG